MVGGGKEAMREEEWGGREGGRVVLLSAFGCDRRIIGRGCRRCCALASFNVSNAYYAVQEGVCTLPYSCCSRPRNSSLVTCGYAVGLASVGLLP